LQRLNSSRNPDAGPALLESWAVSSVESLAHARQSVVGRKISKTALIGRKVMYSRVG